MKKRLPIKAVEKLSSEGKCRRNEPENRKNAQLFAEMQKNIYLWAIKTELTTF